MVVVVVVVPRTLVAPEVVDCCYQPSWNGYYRCCFEVAAPTVPFWRVRVQHPGGFAPLAGLVVPTLVAVSVLAFPKPREK